MKSRGVGAIVVDGGVRDVSFLRDVGVPLFTRYRTPAQAIGRWKVISAQSPVAVRGALQDWVTVNPGDVVVGDEDGVVIVPSEMAETVAQKAKTWETKDQAARRDIQNGMKLVKLLFVNIL